MSHLHPAQRESLRAMTPARRLELGMQMIASARALQAAAIRAQHSDWTPEQVSAEVRRRWLYARS